MNLDGISVLRRDIVVTDDHSGVCVGVTRYAGIDCRGPETQAARLAREVASERTLPIGVGDWNIVYVMHCVQQGHLDSRRFGVFPLDSRPSQITVDRNSLVTVYAALRNRTDQ